MSITGKTELSVQVAGKTTKVAKAGQGDPLLYLHGAFAYGGWPPFLDRLAQRFTVYAPVHPGFGESDGIEGIDDLLDLTLYHFDLLDALELDAPHIVGHFFGAMIAAEMAVLCSHRVGKLVLASPAGIWLDDNPGVDYFVTPASELRSILFTDPESDVAKGSMPDPADDEERAQQGIERVRSLSTVGRFLWPVPDKGLTKRLHRVKSPTLVLVGERDPIVPPEHGAEVSSRIAGSQLRTLRHAGHLAMLEQPDEFVETVAGFLAT